MCMCFKVEAISSRFETVWTKFDTTKELTKALVIRKRTNERRYKVGDKWMIMQDIETFYLPKIVRTDEKKG